MSEHLKAASSRRVTVEMSGEYADKLTRSLGRMLAAIDHMDAGRRNVLVNTGTVDDLLAVKTAIENA